MSSTQEAGDVFGPGLGPAHAMLRSPTVLIASVGLWGMNIYFFRLFGIDYAKVLKHDLIHLDGESGDSSARDSKGTEMRSFSGMNEYSPEDDGGPNDEEFIMEGVNEPLSAITWSRLVSLSVLWILLLHFTYFIWIDRLNGGPVGAVFSFYLVVAISIALPFPSLNWLRRATGIVLQRGFELFNPRCSGLVSPDSKSPPRPIPFVDVFFADAMCSLSKVFFDWGILLHMASNPGPMKASAQNILIPSALAAIPYVIRARQCIVMYRVCYLKADPKRFQHLWNALKYSTSIFPLCLSAYSKTISPKKEQHLERYLIFLLVINALYALYWDIVMDWGMMQNPMKANNCGRALLRQRLRFGAAMSALILVADAVLRFSWLLRFSKSMFPSEDSFVLCTQFLEVFRRAIWNLLRVEWENLKQMKAHLHTTPQTSAVEEKVALVGRTSSGKIHTRPLANSGTGR